MSDSQDFIEALQNNDLKSLANLPKSDLHNHSTRGGNLIDFNEHTGQHITVADNFEDLDAMQRWYDENIKPYAEPDKLVELALKQVNRDGIKLLHMSFGLKNVTNYKKYFEQLQKLQTKFAPDTTFIPEMNLGRAKDVYEVEKLFDEVLPFGFFKSIDLTGYETISVKPFQNLFRKAKKHRFILKAHLGEFEDAQSVMKAVETLDLDQIQHGISISNSAEVMSEIKKRGIQLNVCPTSNVKLGRAKDYQSHPIRKLFDNGVKVTINTDDMLLFDSSVSEEYMHLYESSLFSAEELNEIRLQGLNASNYGREQKDLDKALALLNQLKGA